ncbi:Myb-like DNA-binding domain-containing protein [Zychaea mexicana]|uniref:Myb-like DNA-binding domain-containing protein n=1 Tax=Zychaea mexicana TaxID=64656 RepID=UPI0022FEC8DF|nr:Myb-like DNA-binding domain-containing protein [Zychaea mexicana]KAI9497968.1 Myb-like DNA-binding domain-containing protein [Zychaea mexicana]
MDATEAVVPNLQKANHHKSQTKRLKHDDTKHTKKKSKKDSNDDYDKSKKRKHRHGQNDRSSSKKKRKIKDLIDKGRKEQKIPTISDDDTIKNVQVPTPSAATTSTTTTTTTTASTTTKPANEKKATTAATDIQTYDSASDSDDEDDNSSNNIASSTPAAASHTRTTTTTKAKRKDATLTHNRILPTLHYVYDDGVDMKTQIKDRRMVIATVKVNRDYYISDSDEESDSDDDGSPEYPWHEKMTDRKQLKAKVDSGEWKVKMGRFTIEELIKLEKRIKKIGRRENLTLEQLRETILAENFKANSKFWHRIVKVFPDRSLTQIYNHTKECYHVDAYKVQWTKEEDEKLLELVKQYDNHFSKIAKEMDRTRKACHDRYRTLKNKSTRRRGWTKDEMEKLDKAVKEYTQKHGKDISWEYIAKTYFDGERNQLQIRKKWDSMQHTSHEAHEPSAADVVIVRTRKDVTVQAQLMLFEQMQNMGWRSENAIDYNKVNTDKFKINKETARKTYYKMRDSISGCEKMKFPEIIDRLVTTRRAMVESLNG